MQAGIRLDTLAFPADLTALPLTTKAELVADQEANPPWGTALTEPLDQLHALLPDLVDDRTPLRWIDTNESWQWMLECWKAVYRAARVGPRRSRVLSVFLRAVSRLLGGFEAGCQMGLHCDSRRRDVEPACGWR